jgi:hypothetical protein
LRNHRRSCTWRRTGQHRTTMDSVEKCFQTQMAKTTSLLRDVDEWSLRTLQELKECPCTRTSGTDGMPRTSLLLGLNLRRPHVTRHRWLQTKTEYPGVSDSCDVPARVWALVTYLDERKTSGTQVGALLSRRRQSCQNNISR